MYYTLVFQRQVAAVEYISIDVGGLLSHQEFQSPIAAAAFPDLAHGVETSVPLVPPLFLRKDDVSFELYLSLIDVDELLVFRTYGVNGAELTCLSLLRCF